MAILCLSTRYECLTLLRYSKYVEFRGRRQRPLIMPMNDAWNDANRDRVALLVLCCGRRPRGANNWENRLR